MAIPLRYTTFEEIKSYDVLSTDPSKGFYQTRIKSPYQKRTFRITMDNANLTERNAFISQFNATRAGAGTLSLSLPTNMGGGTVTVRFLDDTLTIEKVGNGPIFNLSASFVTVGPSP